MFWPYLITSKNKTSSEAETVAVEVKQSLSHPTASVILAEDSTEVQSDPSSGLTRGSRGGPQR